MGAYADSKKRAVTIEQGGWIHDYYHCRIGEDEWSASASDIARARKAVAKWSTSCVKVGSPWLWLDESMLDTIERHMAGADEIDMCRVRTCDRPGFRAIDGEFVCEGHA
jgi:hypothetical protein